MNSSTQEEDGLSARSYALQKILGREGAATGRWLRLRAAVVAAAVAVLFILGTGAAQFAQAQVESVLHSFEGPDGAGPHARLVMDSSGNLYGTTAHGGGAGFDGTVFEMVYDSSTHSYTEKVLYSFTGTDGEIPYAGLIMDSAGNLYGTTFVGGSTYTLSTSPGDGTVFELSPPATSGGNWTEKVLYSFTGTDGYQPYAGLIMDSNGNLYGTTDAGGSTYTSSSSAGDGTVFELSPPTTPGGSWTEKVLYSFTGTDGDAPLAALIMDSSGNLHGTTTRGGPSGHGTVFELTPTTTGTTAVWSEKVLYDFGATSGDGYQPVAGLIMNSKGNLYGTTWSGGASGYGTVFELSPPTTSGTTWTEKVLYSFTGTDGWQPEAGLIMDSAGNLYGTTDAGGSSGHGTVFELTQASGYTTEKFLYSFTGGSGSFPYGSLIMDPAGNLYSTTGHGGSNLSAYPSDGGTVFGIAPVAFSVAGFDFGSVAIGTTSAAKTVTITNIGSGNFSYSAASISGTNAADFAITSNSCSTTLAPNGTCSVSVTFTPSTATAETALLNLSQGGMTQTVSLTGTGVYPTVDLSASTLTFSSQLVGSTSSSQTVTVTNSSPVTLNITSVGITDDFAVASNTCTGSVAAGKTCTVGVTFTPTASGARTGTLTFNDDTSAGSETVSLTGTGAITTVSVSPTTLSFGQQMVGTKSPDQMVTVTNSGASTNLAFSSISVSSNFAIDAAKTTCTTTGAVAPGGSCQVAVHFAPTIVGTLPGTLTLADDASPATQSVALIGTGEAISVSPSSLTFGSTVVGKTSSAETVTVTNNGTSGVTFTGFPATGDFAVDATGTTCPTSTALAGGATCKVAVTFTPTAAGTETGSLTVASDAGTGMVALTGTGTAPGVTLSPSSLTFSGTVVGNTASAQSVTLTNNGTSSLTISGITASGEFAIASAGTTCSTSTALAASSSCTIAVTFTPDGPGTNTGAVTITDNADSSLQIIALSGEGADFTLGVASGSSSSASVSAGGSASYTLALAPEGGFNQAVDLACSGAPAYATCTVSPASVTLNGTSNSSVSVKVSTTAASLVAPGPGDFGPPPSGGLPVVAWLAIIGLLGLIVLVEFSPKGGLVRRAAPWATLALAAALCAGCGGGSTATTTTASNSTPTGTYTLTVTGTSGSLTQTSQVTLTVK